MGPEAMHWRDRALAAEAEVKRLRATTDCPCCGQFRGNCVCWGGMMTDSKTGKTTSYRCSPEQHHPGRGQSDG